MYCIYRKLAHYAQHSSPCVTHHRSSFSIWVFNKVSLNDCSPIVGLLNFVWLLYVQTVHYKMRVSWNDTRCLSHGMYYTGVRCGIKNTGCTTVCDFKVMSQISWISCNLVSWLYTWEAVMECQAWYFMEALKVITSMSPCPPCSLPWCPSEMPQ